MGHENPKKSKPVSRGHQNGEISFINHTLSREEERQMENTDLESELPFSLALDSVQLGYRFTLSFNERNRCFSASLTDQRHDSIHSGKCLSGRGSTPVDAWLSLAFRHYVLAEEDWSYFGSTAPGTEQRRFW